MAGIGILLFCYALVISMMCWRSIARYLAEGNQFGAGRAVVGAILRLICDGIMFFNIFTPQLGFNTPYVTTSYFLAQYFLASSVVHGSVSAVAIDSRKKK
jgi:uncharacterized membrane protein YhhN